MTDNEFPFQRVVVTGGAGFIGSSVCRHLVRHSSAEIFNFDKLTYAGNLESLREVSGDGRYISKRAISPMSPQ